MTFRKFLSKARPQQKQHPHPEMRNIRQPRRIKNNINIPNMGDKIIVMTVPKQAQVIAQALPESFLQHPTQQGHNFAHSQQHILFLVKRETWVFFKKRACQVYLFSTNQLTVILYPVNFQESF